MKLFSEFDGMLKDKLFGTGFPGVQSCDFGCLLQQPSQIEEKKVSVLRKGRKKQLNMEELEMSDKIYFQSSEDDLQYVATYSKEADTHRVNKKRKGKWTPDPQVGSVLRVWLRKGGQEQRGVYCGKTSYSCVRDVFLLEGDRDRVVSIKSLFADSLGEVEDSLDLLDDFDAKFLVVPPHDYTSTDRELLDRWREARERERLRQEDPFEMMQVINK